MSGHPKEPCEICGKMVTTLPHMREKHMAIHENKSVEADVEKRVVDTEDMPKVIVSKDKQIQRDYERAMQARETRRKSAPNILTNPVPHTDALTQIENHLRREGVIPEKMHCFWGDKKMHSQYIGEGYVPAVERGELTDHGENRLYYIDDVVHYAEEMRSVQESRSRISALNKEGESTIAEDGEQLPDDSMKISRDRAVQKAQEARERREAELVAQM